jgi:anti-sigma factor RsiW
MTGTVDIHALVGAYALDAVDDLERAAFERHLRDCGACSAEVAELRETATWLAQPVAEAPPARLREAVLAQVASTPQERPKRVAASTGRTDRNRLRRWAASAAAAAVLAAGASAGTWAITQRHYASQDSQIDAVLAAADAHIVSKEVNGGRVTMIVSPSHDAGIALLNGLDSPGPDKTYQLWMLDEGTKARSVDTSAGSGRYYVRGLTSEFGVSLEKKGGSDVPHEVVGKLQLR